MDNLTIYEIYLGKEKERKIFAFFSFRRYAFENGCSVFNYSQERIMVTRKVYSNQQDGTIPAAYPIKHRTEQTEYLPWKEVILAGGRVAGEKLMRQLYDLGWDAAACREMMADCNLYGLPKVNGGYRPVHIDLLGAQKRISNAVYKECARLLARRMTPDAKGYVQKMSDDVKEFLFRNDIDNIEGSS